MLSLGSLVVTELRQNVKAVHGFLQTRRGWRWCSVSATAGRWPAPSRLLLLRPRSPRREKPRNSRHYFGLELLNTSSSRGCFSGGCLVAPFLSNPTESLHISGVSFQNKGVHLDKLNSKAIIHNIFDWKHSFGILVTLIPCICIYRIILFPYSQEDKYFAFILKRNILFPYCLPQSA